MCLKPNVRAGDPKITPRFSPIAHSRACRKLDEVVAVIESDETRTDRLRALIGRSVMAGLAPPASGLARSTLQNLPLVHPCRGGAELAFARQVAMYLAHVACGLTYTQAARLYGRDRTTAAHGCRLVEERRDDPVFDRILDLLERCVRAGSAQIDFAVAPGARPG